MKNISTAGFIALLMISIHALGSDSSVTSMGTSKNIYAPSYDQTYQKYVDASGNIKVPTNYRTEFVFIGSFVVPSNSTPLEVKQLHQVYIDKDSISYYQNHGEFPDGAMLVKELQGVGSADLTTGHASFWKNGQGWFVMIKDNKKRHQENLAWGDGWGWALMDQDAPEVTTNEDKSTCISCHTPVKKTDWVHVWGYPLLNAADKISTLNSN